MEARSEESIHSIVRPFNEYEDDLRALFSEDPPPNPSPSPYANLVDIFKPGNPSKVKIRRSLRDPEKYLFPLQNPKPDGQKAIVQSLDEFRINFNAFTNSAFTTFSQSDWSNIIVAGGSVTMCLQAGIGSCTQQTESDIQQHFLQVAPRSDIDIFIYGILDEGRAIDRILEFERKLKRRESTRVVRTRNALTIVSGYPHRHIQIVLRLYRSISEILTGFDVNCCCVAYNGETVFGSPRG